MFPPIRIVCLTEETVETLYLLGEQDRIVGISGYVVRPPQARHEKPRVSAFTSANIDKMVRVGIGRDGTERISRPPRSTAPAPLRNSSIRSAPRTRRVATPMVPPIATRCYPYISRPLGTKCAR